MRRTPANCTLHYYPKRLLRNGVVTATLGLFALACNDTPTELHKQTSIPGPLFVELFTSTNSCMGDDAVANPGLVSGFGTDPLAFNCTANDIRIANARTLSGAPIECAQDEQITVDIVADVTETATSERLDIGIWIAEDGGTSAESGQCAHFFLPLSGGAPIEDLDDDQCGDLEDAAVVTGFSLESLDLVCDDPDGDGKIEIPACVSWTIPGGDRVCPTTTGGERAGTLPANKSKCNCEPFFVDIVIKPTLTLAKVVVNDDGGTAVDTDWTLTATGPETISGNEGDAAITNAAVAAGTYTLSESGPAGYSASDWVCTGGGTFTSPDQIELESGDNVTCTITNDDVPATLTLEKVVVNDNGGTAVDTDWTLTATGPETISGNEGDAAITDASVDVGTYTLSESGPTGYTASAWVCTGGGTFTSPDQIQLAAGDDVTCTITNNDNAPSLTLVKVVVNDNGGTATASDWTLTATGPTGFSGAGPSVSNGASFDAGTYDLSETGPAGYTASNWVCVGGTQDDGDTITLALGESATCTITNDDVFQGEPGNSINVRFIDFTVSNTDGDPAFEGLSGEITVQNVSSNIVTVTLITITAEFKPSGGGGFSAVAVSGCTFSPNPPFNIAVGGTQTITFSNCTLSPELSQDGTLRVTADVDVFGAPGKQFLDRRSENVDVP